MKDKFGMLRISPLNNLDEHKRKQTKFGKWEVGPDGEMTYDGDRYWIEKERLTEEDWILHLSEKAWIDWNEFIPAFLQALENAKIKKVTILAYYND
jgi:hypothetical protein